MGPTLATVSLDDLGQRFAPEGKVQQQLARAHARLSVYVLGILNHLVGEHRRHATPASLTGRPDQEATEVRVDSVDIVDIGDIVLLLPWLVAFTRGGDSRQRDATQQASEEEKLERASSACSHAVGVKVAARKLLAEPRSTGNA